MSMLDRKLLRDLVRLWAQALAVALVMACGVATIILAVGASRSLEETRSVFYDRYRFADVFARVTRAPRWLGDKIGAIPGVASVEMQVVRPVILPIEGMAEPATGIAVSLPEHGEPAANRLYIRAGRLPSPERANEVAVAERFAVAHQMTSGTRFSAVMDGHKLDLVVTGIVLSPEYVYAIGPGDMVPDPRRFGVLFMNETTMAGLFDMDGAFNSLAVRITRNASLDAVIAGIDSLTKPYGGTGAYDRSDQLSHSFLDSELSQLRAMATVIPPIFLFAAAFLVNMILSRLIAVEREQIGLLKAIGYPNSAVAWHYAKFALVIAAIGVAIGAYAGRWLGQGITRLYAEQLFSFPFLIFRESPDLYLIAGMIVVIAALIGALRAIANVVRLSPAIAMQPPAPPSYRALFGKMHWRRSASPARQDRQEKARGQHLVSLRAIIALRHLVRYPARSLMTALGSALAVALLIVALFPDASIEFMIDTTFFRSERQDASLIFADEQGPGVLSSVANMPGVMRAEGYRTTLVLLEHEHRRKRLSLNGIPANADLSQVLDTDLNPITIPQSGILLTERAASLLDLRLGEKVTVQLLERPGHVVEIPVSAIVGTYIGIAAYVSLETLDRMMGEGPRISSARIRLDAAELPRFYDLVKETPAIASLALLDISRQRFRETIEKNIAISTTIYIILAIIITFGVVYNSARIQFSEHARELASLRVFGFTGPEVASVIFIELGIVIILAQPMGWLLGYVFSYALVKGFESDLFRVPFLIEPETMALASLVTLAAAAASAMILFRRIGALDLVRVLKTRD